MPQASSFIPRTERIPAEASRQPSPAEFAEILIKKLEKVKREQELDEKLNKKLAEDAQSMVSQGSNRSLADILREKLIVTDDMDGDQSILDDHVSRIWTDKTPLRSPGDPRYILLHCLFSSFLTHFFTVVVRAAQATEAGLEVIRGRRQGQRWGLRLPDAAWLREAPSEARPSLAIIRYYQHNISSQKNKFIYHQDLAYYDLGPGPASGPVQQQPGGPGVNERVREWMLDVERHSGDQGGDQRSQHSKTNMKTSPRSNRMKSGGHQERLMSTSWSQGGYPGGQMSGPPSEAEKRRLAASLVMPPPSSQANTLRRSQAAPGPAAEVTVAGEQRNVLIMKRVDRGDLVNSIRDAFKK